MMLLPLLIEARNEGVFADTFHRSAPLPL